MVSFGFVVLYQAYSCKERTKHRDANQAIRRQVKNSTTVFNKQKETK